MILATVAEVLAVVDAFAGFALGMFVGWWVWRHRPPDRRYSVDLIVRRPKDPPE